MAIGQAGYGIVEYDRAEVRAMDTSPTYNAHPAPSPAPHFPYWRQALFASALLIGVAARLSYSWNAPFWFDETYSGVIATQTRFAAAVDWCLHELSGPGFYLVLWAWRHIAGDSDMALRLPSIVCSIAAPLLLYFRGHPDRDVRTFWAVLVLLWLPADVVAGEARPYPQLFLLGVLQAMAFRRLIETPTRGLALRWGLITACAILTSYNALAISGVQAVLFIARQRRRALAMGWPAVLPLLMVAGWMAAHLGFLLHFVRAQDASYSAMPLAAIATLPTILFGAPLLGLIILGVVAVTALLYWRPRQGPDANGLVALSGMIAVGAVFAIGFINPGFAPRYLTPSMPALLFGFALWARWQAARDSKPVAVVMALLLLSSAELVRSALTEPDRDPRHAFNFETASAWIDAGRPQRLVFFWDGPTSAAGDAPRLAEVGGYFLARAGHPIPVDVARAGRGDDPNAAVLALARQHPGAAILWLSNIDFGAKRVPQIAERDPRYQCRDFGGGLVTVTACRWRTG